jgi:assimilatory nitrate reductase catalytic subunit
VRRYLAMPLASPPGVAAKSVRVVCVCFGVTDTAIREELGAIQQGKSDPLAALQAKLKCGTECGSCMPELRGLVAQSL